MARAATRPPLAEWLLVALAITVCAGFVCGLAQAL